jgi:hypothetical protein
MISVFLSHVAGDRSLAQRIGNALAQAGAQATSYPWEVRSGDDLAALVQENVRSGDVVIVLWPANPGASRLAGAALLRELGNRGADLIPVLSAPADLPAALRAQAVVDLIGDADAGLRQLLGQIQAAARADFSVLNGPQFESLVADLLRATGFLVDETGGMPDSGVDMRATYRRTDPFGSPETEVWLVQAKLYKRGHVSVATIRDLAGILAAASGETRGLLVTSAQVTSVAMTYAAELQRNARVRLRVLDGLELRRMLRQFPAVAARHFGGANDQAETMPDAYS